MQTFAVLMRKELREQWRTYRLGIVAAVALLFGLLSPVLAKYLPELLKNAGGSIQVIVPTPTAADAVDQTLKNLGTNVATLAAILLAMSLMAREKERGTAALVLTKPVSRAGFIGAKFLALALTLGAALLTGGVAAYGYTAWLFEPLTVAGFGASLLLLWLLSLVYAAITFLASTVLSSTLAAAGVGIGGWILLSALGAVPALRGWLPDMLLAPARALALGQPVEGLWQPLLVALGIIGLSLLSAWMLFRQQEL